MSVFMIETVDHHQQMLDRIERENAQKIAAMPFEEAGLSSWARSNRGIGHGAAVLALQMGREYGSTEPAAKAVVLIDSDGRNIGAAQERNQWFRYQWVLPADAAARYGRRYIPMGKNSRVQRDLGLREVVAVVTIERKTEMYAPSKWCLDMREIHVKGAPVLAVTGESPF